METLVSKWLLVIWITGNPAIPRPEVWLFDTQHDCQTAQSIAAKPGVVSACAQVQSISETDK